MSIRPEDFLRFEEENDLFEKSINGIHYWQLVRAELYNYILDIQFKHESRHPDLTNNKKPKIQSVMRLFLSSVLHRHDKISKNLILLSSSSNRNGQTELIIKLKEDSFAYLNRPVNYLHEINNHNVKMIYPDFMELIRGAYIVLLQHNTRIIRMVKKDVNSWLGKMENEFDMHLDLDTIVNKVIYSVGSIQVLYPYFKKMIKKWKPSKVVLSPYYERFNLALIKAARFSGIRIYEYQHGAISKYHIAYNYFKMHDEYLPDYFLFFGDYWKNTIVFPEKERILVTGSLALEEKTNWYKRNNAKKKVTKGIAFISQGPFTNLLYPFAEKLVELFEDERIDYRVYYKLHPNEVKTWDLFHKNYNDKRIIMETGDYYDLMSKIDYQIGINSTALFEGVAFNISTLIIDCDYLEESDMRAFCDMGYGRLISKPEDVVDIIKNGNVESPKSEDFWHSNSEDCFKKALKIIS